MSTGDSSNDFSEFDLGETIKGFSQGLKLFGRFTLVRTLGRGGMGVVWLARDEDLGEEVALKFVPEMIISDRMALEGLKRETLRSRKLTHHHIVRIHDFHQAATTAGISMEFVDGETISNLRLERENLLFEPEELAPWVEQLCGALDYAHGRAKVVHRDLKPANLMITREGELKVADFGIAASLSESVSRVSVRQASGTLVYMSPQQLDGEMPTAADDIYALGATLYDLLTTKPPFFQGNVDRQIREKTPIRLAERRKQLEVEGRDIPAVWEETILACLAKDPTQRPQSASEIWARLSGQWTAPVAVEQEPVIEIETPTPETAQPAPIIRVPKPATRGSSKGLLITVGVLVVAAIIGGVIYFARDHSPREAGSASSPAPLVAANVATPAPPTPIPATPVLATPIPATPVPVLAKATPSAPPAPEPEPQGRALSSQETARFEHGKLANSRWNVSASDGERVEWRFKDDGTVEHYVGPVLSRRGNWQAQGSKISMTVGLATLTAEFKKDRLIGSGSGGGVSWTFQALPK